MKQIISEHIQSVALMAGIFTGLAAERIVLQSAAAGQRLCCTQCKRYRYDDDDQDGLGCRAFSYTATKKDGGPCWRLETQYCLWQASP